MRPRVLAAVATAAAVILAACSTGPSTSTPESPGAASTPAAADPNGFPVTIGHAFGETTITSAPQRVATLGWSDQDHALALGVAPVGATSLTWGGNAAGSSDWFDGAVQQAGVAAPVRYSDADGAPLVEIAKLDPDVILATNSGITKEEYAKLSEIAPVVPYPEAPWVTPWQTSLEMVGTALGRTTQAQQVAADVQQSIDRAKRTHPQLDGKSLIFAYLTPTDLSTIGIYAPRDPRVSFLRDLGLVDAPSVAGAIKPGEFYGSVSAEQASRLNSDVLLTWSENPGDMATFTDHPLIGRIPALAAGRAYAEVDKQISLAVTNPTPLSIPVIIDRFVPKVAAAVDGTAPAASPAPASSAPAGSTAPAAG
jgi:iron complex transport system substrate-binding protein